MNRRKQVAAQAQMTLFEPVLNAYKASGELTNDQLYEQLSQRLDLPQSTWCDRVPVGRSGQLHNLPRRSVRWVQQTLKGMGLLERGEARGLWRATRKLDALTPAPAGTYLVAFSTDLGIAIWGRCQDFFAHLDEPIHLVLTSPPYPLARPRAYGNPAAVEYVDWVCAMLEPLVRNLVPGGSICLNVSNDIFEPGSPARSLYRERLVLALCERLGLSKMDELIWHNPTKAPGPMQWASRTRQQLNVAWEPVYWFTNDPQACRSDNRRVLQPHTARHQQLIERGGERRSGVWGDGANRLREGAFAAPTAGRIQRNVITVPHRCASQAAARRAAQAEGLPAHGAMMPLRLASTLVEFLSDRGDLVVDPCAGWSTVPLAAQLAGRRWIGTELMAEYSCGAALRPEFTSAAGYARRI